MPYHLYFITAVTEEREPFLKDSDNIKILLATFKKYREEYQFKIVAFCILPDHFHWLIVPSTKANISKIMKAVKGYSSIFINIQNHRYGRLWQHQFLDHIVRKDEDYKNHIDYIHKNPIKHGLVQNIADYPWSSYNSYYGENNEVFKIDEILL